MQLEHLSIRLQTYGPNEGKYVGEARFKDQHGAVEIVLHPQASDDILRIVANAIVRNSQEVAQQLTVATLTQRALESPDA